MKLHDFAAIDPDHSGKGMSNGSVGEVHAWETWAHRPDTLAVVAAKILEVGKPESVIEPTDDEEDVAADEGAALYRKHRRLERNRALVHKKKKQALELTGKLACEVCDFESRALYGNDASGVIDVHHVVPLHKMGETKTKLSDLALVCPTCHRVIHKHSPFITPKELRAKLVLVRLPGPEAKSGN